MACIAHSICLNGDIVRCPTQETFANKTLESIAKQLQIYKPPSFHGVVMDSVGRNNGDHAVVSRVNSTRKRAAVLICIFEGHEGELRVILTKRSMNLSSHPGEVALPGGKTDEGDVDDSATALREAEEEIGLDRRLVEVVVNLEPFYSRHLVTVVPVVGLLQKIQDFKPVINEDEVDAIFDVPLDMFLKEEGYRSQEREWRGWKYVRHLFDYRSPEQGDFLIGGLTASILIRTATIVYQRPPSFNIDYLPDFQQLQHTLQFVNI